MMRIILALLVLLVLKTGYAQDAINQTDEKGQKQGFWVKQLPNGTKIYEGNFKNDKPVGEFKRYHTSGFLKAKLFYSVKSDTVKAELYDLKGKLMAEGQYLGQLKIGHWKFFQKGRLVSEEEYENNLKQGISKTYYPTGELFEETSWKYDLKDGIYRAYFKNGKPYMECMMKNGKRNGSCKVYFQDGKLELDAFYVLGLRDKEWNYYNPNGDFSHTLMYENGTLTNPMVLDSIQQLKFNELDKNKSKLVDPEKFMNDPLQYMQKNNMLPQ